jgi:hypothetical protein
METSRMITYPLHDGRKIQLTPRGAAGFAVEVRTPDGAIQWSDAPLDLNKDAHRKRIQSGANVALDELMRLLAGLNEPRKLVEDGAKTGAGKVYIRGMKESAAKAEPVHGDDAIDAASKALAWKSLPEDALIYWDESTPLRAVDLDWHQAAVPRADEVERLAIGCKPSPALWWVTHGGGLRLIYTDAGSFTAEELAACAAAYLLSVRPEATAEVKCDTRHPRSARNGKTAGEPQESLPDTVLAILGRFSKRGCTEAERDEWLANQGMHLHGKFAHHFCPIDAHHISKSAAPVWAGDEGIYCASCASRGDGYRSYGRLVGSIREGESPIYLAAKHSVHWEQASYYFSALAPEVPVMLRRPVYSALVKSLHQQDPADDRVKGVFKPYGFVRGLGIWLVAETLQPAAPRLQKEDVARLPYARQWLKDENGMDVFKPDAGKVLRMATNAPLEGMPPLSPLPACPIYGVHNAILSVDGSVPVLPIAKAKVPQARYVPQRERMPLEAAWAVVERHFPGLSREYLTLLHVARGYAEIGGGQLPMIYAQGPSGASKTATSRIESAMAGDVYKDIGMGEWGKVAESIGEAAAESGAVVVNEFAKINAQSKGGAALWALQMGRTMTYRKLYVGSITIPVRCYILMTDTRLPPDLVSNEQFGRRVVYVRLHDPVAWGKSGVTAENWMQQEGAAKAADTIHSYIVDEYFPPNHSGTFLDAAKRLGFYALDTHFEESEDGLVRDEYARALFDAVCDAPVTEGGKHVGRGWVVAGVDQEDNRVGQALRNLLALSDQEDGSTTVESLTNALEPLYGRWKRVLGLVEPAVVEFRKDRRRLFIRFRSDNKKPWYLANKELRRVKDEK